MRSVFTLSLLLHIELLELRDHISFSFSFFFLHNQLQCGALSSVASVVCLIQWYHLTSYMLPVKGLWDETHLWWIWAMALLRILNISQSPCIKELASRVVWRAGNLKGQSLVRSSLGAAFMANIGALPFLLPFCFLATRWGLLLCHVYPKNCYFVMGPKQWVNCPCL